jgi:hypothetical protein
LRERQTHVGYLEALLAAEIEERERKTVLCISMCATAQKEPTAVFACNLKAITADERPRYHELMKRLRLAVRNRSEIANGYTFKLDSKAITLPEAAEWISMERLCCPFLTLQLSVSANQPHWILTLTGPAGVKPLIQAEFPAR